MLVADPYGGTGDRMKDIITQHGGKPAESPEGELRIDLKDAKDQEVRRISWREFKKRFRGSLVVADQENQFGQV